MRMPSILLTFSTVRTSRFLSFATVLLLVLCISSEFADGNTASPDLGALRFNSPFASSPAFSVQQKPAASPDPRAVSVAKRLRTQLSNIKAKFATPAPVLNAIQTKALAELRDRVHTDVEVRLHPLTGTPRRIKAKVLEQAAFGYGSQQEKSLATAKNFLHANKALLKLEDPATELQLTRSHTDDLGRSHLRYSQMYQGVPVWPAELIVHANPTGDIDLLDGAFVSTPHKLNLTPALDKKAALAQARKAVPGGEDAHVAVSELIIYAPGDTPSRLAWKFELGVSLTAHWLVIVDARNGAILTAYNQVTDMNVPGSGVDVFGATQPLNVWQENGTFFMTDTTKPMYDPSSDPPAPDTTRGGITIFDAQNNSEPPFFFVTSDSPTSGWLSDGVSAALNFSETYDYFLQQHNRDSYDDQGSSLNAIVRFDQNHANASWNPGLNIMLFGDADLYAGALDVVGHELTHGVTNFSANLVYQNQPGALNEAFSDIFGQLVEARTEGGADWIVGDSLDEIFRVMDNPSSVEVAPGSGRFYPQTMSDFFGPNDPFLALLVGRDNGGVHINSSIINHTFYLLAEGLSGAIGLQDAGQIFFRALTVHLVANSQFIDTRLACIQSAEEIFGQGSSQVQKTIEAFDGTEIFAAAPTPDPQDTPSVGGPDATLFVQRDASTGNFLLGRRESAFGDGAPGVQLANSVVAASRPSVSRNGVFAVFVNAQNDLCLIGTDGGGEDCLGVPGLVASVAMSPDGQLFGFVFLDDQGNRDNQISVIDLRTDPLTTRTFMLTAPLLDGATSDTVRFASTMDFTIDGELLFYDALNTVTFTDGSQIDLWSMYSFNLETETILAVVPPTPGLDVNFPSLSQTSDTFLTFDIFNQQTNQSTVVAGNLNTLDLTPIATINGGFGVPGYTGDDLAIVYSQVDGATSTGFSLVQQPLADDRMTPQGQASTWLTNADFGVIYRRARLTGALENPFPGSFQSGVGLFSGWVCDALRVDIEIDGTALFEAAYGTSRGDTAGMCGDTNNGFALIINWNLLGNGQHTVRALADGVAFGTATFTVATLGTEFLSGASGTYTLSDFPQPGQSIQINWQQASQNFIITDYQPVAVSVSKTESVMQSVAGPGALENPLSDSFQSGIGLFSGWVCDAQNVEIEIDGSALFEAAYGTSRGDTAGICGDTNNGFGVLINWNLLGDGQHTVRALADGEEFGSATFTVTTLGTEFLSGVSGGYLLSDFPQPGTDVVVEWQQGSQNFVITGVQ